MHRISLAVLCLMIALFGGALLMGGPIAGASESQVIEDGELTLPVGTITIEPPDEIEPLRSSVEYPHSRHFDFNCKTCHHIWDGGAVLNGCMTSECHDVVESPKKTGKKQLDPDVEILYFKKAYHKLCLTCHSDMKKKNKEVEMAYGLSDAKILKTGPTSCLKCHPKE